MLSSQNRITRGEGFTDTMRLGSRAGNRALVVYLRFPANDEDDEARAGIVIAKRQVRKAVDRNRIKRRLRHQVAELLPDLPPGSRLVVRGLAPAAGMSSAELRSALDRLLATLRRKEAAKRGEDVA